jgi:hypothetical protein
MLGNDENIVATKSRDEHVVNLIKSIQAADSEISTLREHIADVKKSYVENNWLQKEEVQLAVKAYKQLKGKLALDDVVEYAEVLKDVVV